MNKLGEFKYLHKYLSHRTVRTWKFKTFKFASINEAIRLYRINEMIKNNWKFS